MARPPVRRSTHKPAARAGAKQAALPKAKQAALAEAADTDDSDRLPDNIALLLQGGGALGAYQAGVYQGLHEAGIAPNWLAGISIGSFNIAIIAGNPPERRMEALRGFWETISQPTLLPATTFGSEAHFTSLNEHQRGWLDSLEALRAMVEGQRGFYQPRSWLGQDPLAGPGPDAASWYDNSPMIATLERMVDFDRLNDAGTRVSVGAVDVASGNLEYFDNTRTRLDARHILASGALPPAFPAVEIDGRYFWDGGLVSNTPLSHVLQEAPHADTLMFQVDLWSARGALPQTLLDVDERRKDIQYSSRTRQITDTQRVASYYRRLLRELLEEIPQEIRESNPWCRHAADVACQNRTSVIHLIYRDHAHFGHFKAYQFGRMSMREHWQCGLADIGRALAHPEWLRLPSGENTFVTHDATAP